ncbi:CRISPR-associated protein Csx11 [Methanomethylovorans sp.]|uniref:CRISPR-associated protein Csx11 n=1 Tax=Methanomethylovorans sp. TaxID=2758717 RepID=UPI000A5AF13A
MSKDSNFLDLNVLAENRDALLLAEVAAWLHMIGKYHESFLKSERDADLKIPADLSSNYQELDLVLRNGLKSFLNVGAKLPQKMELDFTIYDFISKHRNRNPQGKWIKCLVDAHGRGSGTEKGILNDKCYLKQDGKIYLSSPFAEDELIFENNINQFEPSISTKANQLYSFLESHFKLLDSIKSNIWGFNDWDEWRTQFIEMTHLHFDSSVADDRVPINDVSLWDQTASSVAFFKCEVAEAFLYGWKDPLQNKPKFRILKIALDGDKFISDSSFIGDVLSRRDGIKKGFEKIKKLLEINIPLGFEIYSDHNQILFLVPDINKNLCLNNEPLESLIQKQFDYIFKQDIQLDISLSDLASRNVYFIGKMMNSRKKPLLPSVSKISEHWTVGKEKCISCHIRPQSSSFNRKLCDYCLERIKGRSREWIQKRNASTIWIDEVADANGKISLVVAQFDLNDWLNGKMISSFRNPKNESLPTFCKIVQELDEHLDSNISNNIPLSELINGFILKKLDTVDMLYAFLVESEDLTEDAYSSLKNNEKIALAVWRKTPSFARVRRVWETTFKFWDEIKEDLNEIVKPITLRLTIKSESEINLPENSSYKAMSGDISFTIFCTKGNEYIIIENVERLAKKIPESQKGKNVADLCTKICTYLKGKNINIYDPDGKKRDEPLGSLQISDVIPEDANYTPVIPVLAEPSIFMAIVPADKAVDISKAIKEKYETEMGKVRNRLPLTLGMVFAKSHTPISSLMDAGRRMLQNNSKKEKPWKVKSITDEETCDSGHKYRILEFENEIKWKVPVTMRDGQTQDIWYPYYYIDEKDIEPEEREKSFKGPDGWLVHVSEIKESDTLHILPSTFDFELLDSSSRRFEISYDDEGRRRDNTKLTRPYLLEELDEFDKIWDIVKPEKLNKSQLKKVMYLLETKRTEWQIEDNNPVFKIYVSDVFNNASWLKKPEKKEEIVKAAASGKLKDVIELYMDISKIRK